MSTDKTRWFVSPSVLSSHGEDGALLLDVKKGLSYKLNLLGAQVWVTIERSSSGITLQGIVDASAAQFRVPRDQLELDIADWLDKLKQLGLLQEEKRRAPTPA